MRFKLKLANGWTVRRSLADERIVQGRALPWRRMVSSNFTFRFIVAKCMKEENCGAWTAYKMVKIYLLIMHPRQIEDMYG